tara:strand:+ start:40 stop:942 length:903 start_codon:yes stop_codon:yes gene_type:complete
MSNLKEKSQEVNKVYMTNEIKQTNLSVELTLVTPKLAENYLRFNNKNRKLSSNNLQFLVNEMKSDRFIENGEAIVFDKNGYLKDGQHRLGAILRSGKSFFIPIVRGVNPLAMGTYDTGKNRSSGDVLELNGFKYSALISKFIVSISKYSENKCKASNSSSGFNRRDRLTNQQVLQYCELNYDWLKDIVSKLATTHKRSNPKVLGVSSICIIAYLIGGKRPSTEVYNFINYLIGSLRIQGTSSNYLYEKLYNARVNKESLNHYWVLGMSIKAWNYYIDGNPSVRFFKFDITQELPKPLKPF